MGSIPVLTNTQMATLRGVLSQNIKKNLTTRPNGKTKRYPTDENDYLYDENEEEVEQYNGPFAVTYDPATKTASVKGGWAVANGTWLTVAEASNLKVTEPSYVCVSAVLKEKSWKTEIKIAEPSAENYPVAHTELKKVYLKKYEEGEEGYEESVDGFEPAPEGYEVKKEGTGENEKRYYETLKVIQFYVSVAMFMVVKYCPGVPQ